MNTPEVQAVFDLLYIFHDEVSQVTVVRMPSCMDPHYTYRPADTEASLSQVLTDQQALSWRARSCRNKTERGQGWPPEKQPPYCSTSGRWNPTWPPPPWRTCAMLWTNSFGGLTFAWKSSWVSSDATGTSLSTTSGTARYRICRYDGQRSGW